MHNGLLQLGKDKMSKSLGNLVTIKDALAQHGSDALRLFVLTSHYRSPLAYGDEGLTAAGRGVDRLRAAVEGVSTGAPAAPAAQSVICAARDRFVAAMDDDFNSAGALGHLFDLVRAINTARDAGATAAQLEPAQKTLRALTGVLGLRLAEKTGGGGDADRFIALLVEVRTEMRKQKQWAMSDLIRDKLKELGVAIEDGKDGTSWHW